MDILSAPALFGQMTALADATRSRLLLALDRNELTVNELTAILQLPQSTISRHLKMLSAEGWVEARAEGTSRYYRIASASLDAASRRLIGGPAKVHCAEAKRRDLHTAAP